VRPIHGEIHIWRGDSHPTHKSKAMRSYMANEQHRLQLSPPYVHEGMGDAESFFLWGVPSANALLLAAQDLGEPHFAQALLYVIHASNLSIKKGSSPPSSPAMIYHNSTSYIGSGLHCFGAACKALVHGESRDSKFEPHAEPCVYMGPPTNSDSSAHCTVLTKNEYKDIECGCMTLDESVVMERIRRDHPGTQPYNQVVGGRRSISASRPPCST